MYDTFTGARPIGLLSAMTNQRLPEGVPQIRNRPERQAQEPDADALSTSSLALSLHRQDNDFNSLSPSPSTRQRLMHVPGLPRPTSRMSNYSDRHSQASSTALLDGPPRRMSVRGGRPQAPVSPLAGISPSLLLAQDMPNLAERMRRQPVTPNPGNNRPFIRLHPLPMPDEIDRVSSQSGRSHRS